MTVIRTHMSGMNSMVVMKDSGAAYRCSCIRRSKCISLASRAHFSG